MLRFLASLAKSVSNAAKLALQAVLRLFGQPGGPTTHGTHSTRPGGPDGVVIKSVPDYQERAGPMPAPQASAPPPPARREPEPTFSPAPAPQAPESPAPAPEASAPPSATSEPEPDAPFFPAPAPAPAGPRAPESSAPAPEAPAPPSASSEPEPDAPFSPAPAPVSAGPGAPESSPPTASSEPGDLESVRLEEPEMATAEPDDAAGGELEEMSRAEPGDAADEEPKPEPEPVLLGGSAPKRARPGDVILAQFTAYVKGFEEQARGELAPASTSTRVELGVETDCRWAVGTRVTARCSAKGFAMEPVSETFVWDGECRTVSFDVEVPADTQPKSAVLVMEAFVHDRGDAPDAVQVGRLRMPLEIGDGEDDDEPRQRVVAQTPRTAFASYASEDRLDVLERVSSIRRSAGLEVWMDVVDLRMGEQWNPALDEHILASDRFLLFWSENSAKSRWVTWEREHAIEAHGEDVLELHLLRFTPIDQVPEELRKYHFNDVYIMARDAELYRRGESAPAPPA